MIDLEKKASEAQDSMPKYMDFSKEILNLFPVRETVTLLSVIAPEEWLMHEHTFQGELKLWSYHKQVIDTIVSRMEPECCWHLSQDDDCAIIFDKECQIAVTEIDSTSFTKTTITRPMGRGVGSACIKKDAAIFIKERVDGVHHLSAGSKADDGIDPFDWHEFEDIDI